MNTLKQVIVMLLGAFFLVLLIIYDALNALVYKLRNRRSRG